MFENLRRRLRNAQPISQPAQANFEQQSPDQAGSGHEAWIQHGTGTGTNVLRLERNLAKVESQLSQTSEPGLKIQLLTAQRNIKNQLLRAHGNLVRGTEDRFPVPDVGYPMGSVEDYFNPSMDFLNGDFNGPISPKATFELAGTLRSRMTSPIPAAKPAGGDYKPTQYFTRNALGEKPSFSYGRPADASGLTYGASTVRGAGVSYAPGRTVQHQHTGPDFGPYGRGLTTSDQVVPGKHGSRSIFTRASHVKPSVPPSGSGTGQTTPSADVPVSSHG
jgi:hypothetical protein